MRNSLKTPINRTIGPFKWKNRDIWVCRSVRPSLSKYLHLYLYLYLFFFLSLSLTTSSWLCGRGGVCVGQTGPSSLSFFLSFALSLSLSWSLGQSETNAYLQLTMWRGQVCSYIYLSLYVLTAGNVEGAGLFVQGEEGQVHRASTRQGHPVE